jgi:hypothetical protein
MLMGQACPQLMNMAAMSDTVAHLAAAKMVLMPWVPPQLIELLLARLLM